MWLASIAGIKGNSHRLPYLIITVCVLSGIANIRELGGLLPNINPKCFLYSESVLWCWRGWF